MNENIEQKKLANDVQTYINMKKNYMISKIKIFSILDKTETSVKSNEPMNSSSNYSPGMSKFKYKFNTVTGVKEYSIDELCMLIFNILVIYDDIREDDVKRDRIFNTYLHTLLSDCCINL